MEAPASRYTRSLMDARDLQTAVRDAILTARGQTAASDRQAAYDGDGPAAAAAYLAKVRTAATTVTDDDIAALRRAGLDAAAIFELTVAAAVGHADRQRAAAEAALVAALEAAP